MRLTVVVPIYNVEKYLHKCIDSIIAQTYKLIEIVLVDDGSTDGSGAIADEYADKYENVYVIHQENQGLSGARNTGIDNCKTELITFVDSDDYIEPNMYEDLICRLDKEKADISIGGVYRENIDGNRRPLYPKGIERVFSKEEALVELNSIRFFNMSVCNVVFKTKLFDMDAYEESRVRFPKGKKSEDEYTSHKLYARANKVVYISTPYYHYVERAGSITMSSEVNTEQLNAAEMRVKFYERWFPLIAYSAKSEYFFSCMALTNVFLEKKLPCPPRLKKKMYSLSKRYFSDVMKNKSIRLKKKVQAVIYITVPWMYEYIIKKVK